MSQDTPFPDADVYAAVGEDADSTSGTMTRSSSHPVTKFTQIRRHPIEELERYQAEHPNRLRLVRRALRSLRAV